MIFRNLTTEWMRWAEIWIMVSPHEQRIHDTFRHVLFFYKLCPCHCSESSQTTKKIQNNGPWSTFEFFWAVWGDLWFYLAVSIITFSLPSSVPGWGDSSEADVHKGPIGGRSGSQGQRPYHQNIFCGTLLVESGCRDEERWLLRYQTTTRCSQETRF